VRLDWALLANAAEGPPDGLVYILGAGIDTLWRDQFPAPFGGAMVLRVLTNQLESVSSHRVEVRCSDDDGNAVLAQPIAFTVPPREAPREHPPGWDLAANIVINLAAVRFERPGIYRFEILVDGELVRTLPFRLVQVTLPPTLV
jgi:uncharacterized protein DUF6941